MAPQSDRRLPPQEVVVHDLLCVGFGPANLAVAVALEEMWPKARVKFVEQAPGPMWQPNLGFARGVRDTGVELAKVPVS